MALSGEKEEEEGKSGWKGETQQQPAPDAGGNGGMKVKDLISHLSDMENTSVVTRNEDGEAGGEISS